jgi:hypothetical protein
MLTARSKLKKKASHAKKKALHKKKKLCMLTKSETFVNICGALHRLQISNPQPFKKLFFLNVHRSKGKSSSSQTLCGGGHVTHQIAWQEAFY